MKQSVQRIEEKIRKGYKLHFGDNLGYAWRVFMIQPVGFTLTFIVLFGLFFGTLFLLPESFVLVLPVFTFPALLTSFMVVSDRIAFNESVTFAHFFEAMFSDWRPYAVGLIKFIVMAAIGLLAFLALDLTNAGLAAENMTFFFLVVIYAYLSLSMFYTVPMLLFFEVNITQAISLSWRLTHKDFGAVLGLGVIMIFLVGLGFSFLLAFIATIPLTIIMIYTSFDETVYILPIPSDEKRENGDRIFLITLMFPEI